MADTFETKKINELTETETASDTDLFAVGDDTTGELKKITKKNMQESLNGDTDISEIGDGTVTGAIKAARYAVVAPD